jgi:FMN-dependent NADH-azoreductase
MLPAISAEEKVMTNILVLNSSVLGDGSASKILVEEALQRLLKANSGATVIHRDLGREPVPLR